MPTSLLRAGPLAADFVSGTNRPTFAVRAGHKVAVFPDTGITETFYTFNMPTVYANGDVNIRLMWMAEVAVGGDMVWEIAFERHEPGVDDLDNPSFAVGVAFVATADVTPGVPTETVIPMTAGQMDSVVNGDQFRIAVRRLGDDSSDLMSGNAQLMTVVIDQDADPAGGGGGGFWTDGAGTRAGIGQGSPAPTAVGLEALAHGTSATAGGAQSFSLHGEAAAANSISMGQTSYVKSTSYDSLAIGYGAKVEVGSHRSIAIGRGARIDQDGPHAIAIGRAADARGNGYSIAIGYRAEAGDNAPLSGSAVAIGDYAEATGQSSVAIGHDAQTFSPNAVAIGSDIYAQRANRSVVLGYNITTGASVTRTYDSVVIGQRLYSNSYSNDTVAIGQRVQLGGGNEILIGNYIGRPGLPGDRSNSVNNIIMCTATDYYAGASNPNGAYQGSNIVLAAGGGRGGLRPYNTISQYRNICISANNAYIYGFCNKNIVMGMEINMGDYQNAVTQNYKNIHIGYGGQTGWFSAAAPNYTRRNTTVGYACYIWTNTIMAVTIGASCGQYYNSSTYYTRNISIGNYCFNYSGHGNVAMGSYCEIKDGAYGYPFNQSRGNFAIGYQCHIKKIGTGAFRSTMAQGVGAVVGVSGQRVWSADAETSQFASPNQGSFVIPKIETLDAVQTTILTFPTIADKAYALWGFIVARRTDVDGFNAVFSLTNTLVYRNAAGIPVLIGDPKAWTQDANQGAPAWTIDISIATNDIVVRVTGTAAQTIEWLGWIQVIEVRG